MLLLRQISFHIFETVKPTCLTYNVELNKSVASFINEWNNDLDFFITKTSGSTGTPKEIQIKKAHAIQSSLNTAKALNLSKGDKALLCLNPDTIGGKMMIVRSLALDLNLFIGDTIANPLEKCDEDLDFIAIVPLQLKAILDESPEKLKSIRNVIVGGGIISNELELLLIQHDLTVYQTFGMTETISHIALKKVGKEGTAYYKTLPNIEISVKNNQLEIHAPSIGVNHLLTTDSIEIIDDSHFRWLGRTDFVINSGGVKIHPEEVESYLSEFISQPFFVTGIDDAKFGQKLILAIQDQPSDKFSKKSIYASLPLYHIPKEIWFYDSFEWTKSNKINRTQTLLNNNATAIRQIS